MKRLLAFTLIATIGSASAALAGESLLSAGTRHVQTIAVSDLPATTAATTASSATPATKPAAPAASYQGDGGTLSKSGMGKGKKTLIYLGLAIGFAASVWTIDHNVLDVTPSSLGTRQD